MAGRPEGPTASATGLYARLRQLRQSVARQKPPEDDGNTGEPGAGDPDCARATRRGRR